MAGKYVVAHDGRRAATVAEIGDRRGDIYRWVFGHNVSAIDAARRLGYSEIVDLLLARATPAQRLLAACVVANRAAAMAEIAANPDLVGRLRSDQHRLIADRAHANDTAAVALMLELGFDPLARGVDAWEPIRWAAFHGNAEMVRLLLPHRPPIGVPDPTYGATLLDQCRYGAVHGWQRQTGDFATTERLLLDAGERA